MAKSNNYLMVRKRETKKRGKHPKCRKNEVWLLCDLSKRKMKATEVGDADVCSSELTG